MRILLTGSGGFIGKNLKSYLQSKYELLTPRSFELDLTDKLQVCQYFERNKIDFIIHCGSIGGSRGVQDKDSTIRDNLAMVENLIQSKREDVRMILFGSGAMYGKDRDLHKVRENQIGSYIPKDLYGQSKLEIAKIVEKRNDILMLIIFACYGYGEKESRFPSYAINQVLQNQDININQNVIFDYLFVEDMAKIVEHFINVVPQNNILNITPSKSSSLREIADIVRNFGGKDTEVKTLSGGMNFEYTGDNSLLLHNFENLEFTPLNVGLKHLFDYIASLRKER